MTSIPRSIASAGLTTLLAMPVAGSTFAAERSRPAALEGTSIIWCGDVEDVKAGPELYGDSPVYVYDAPTDRIGRWARQKPGFQELWIDRDNFGWITVGFTKRVEARQAELEREFPEVGVVAVEVPRTRRELRRLQKRLGDRLFGSVLTSGAMSAHVPSGVVELGVGEVTEELVAVLEEEFSGEPLCVDGGDPSEVVQPGPQPTEGDGWTLVGHQRKDGPPWYRTGIATDRAQLGSLWTEAGMPGEAADVDFVEHVVVWFAEPHGSSCQDQRLDDVIVERERSLVHASIVMPDNPAACTADLRGAHHFFVTLERDRLPPAPFIIQLGPQDPPAGLPEERTVVDIDLSVPGSVAKEGDVHGDEGQPAPQPERSGAFIEPRTEVRYAFDTRCGVGYLGEINDIHWVTDEVAVPSPWEGLIDEDGEIVVNVRLRGEPDPHVTAAAEGHSVRYEPVREAPSPCLGSAMTARQHRKPNTSAHRARRHVPPPTRRLTPVDRVRPASERAASLAAKLDIAASAFIHVIEDLEQAWWHQVREPGVWSVGKDAETSLSPRDAVQLIRMRT